MASPVKLIHIIPANRWGGIERYALDICRHYREKGWDICAITRDAKAVDALFEKEGLKILHAPFGGRFDFQSTGLLTRMLRKTEGDVIIHTHGSETAFTALTARKLSGKSNVKILMSRHKVKAANDSWLFRKIYSSLDAMIFVSRIAYDRFLSTWDGKRIPFDISNFYVIHNSININCGELKKREQKGPLSAMFHGPVISGKGLETLIESLVLLKGERFRMKIMGSGPPDYADKIRRLAISRGVMDTIDWIRHSDMPMEFIMDCDFGVLPSVKEEAFGLSNIEYMACGKPQICSANGAQKEYLTNGEDGLLINPGDPKALADAIKLLIGDADLREKMGEKAYEVFNEKLSWPNFIKKLDGIYSKLLNKGESSDIIDL